MMRPAIKASFCHKRKNEIKIRKNGMQMQTLMVVVGRANRVTLLKSQKVERGYVYKLEQSLGKVLWISSPMDFSRAKITKKNIE